VHVDVFDHIGTAAPRAAERRGWAVAIVAAALLHLIIPVGLLLYASLTPQPAPPVEEIPIEVVVEEPKPPEPKPEEQPKPPPKPVDERPAYDAPAAATEEKANRESREDKSEAPKTDTQPPAPPGAPPKSDKEQTAPEQKAETPPEPQKPPDEAEQAAATPPAPKVSPQPAPAPAPAAPAPPGAPLPEAMTFPEYKFARAATESPVTGGNADSRYFTIVFGMIKQHMREPHSGPRPRPAGGAIVFTVDEAGNLVERRVIAQSGSPSLDMAMMNAIAEGAPYPPPPDWQPKSMRLVYGKQRPGE
jgi:periplasmic protein TonB